MERTPHTPIREERCRRASIEETSIACAATGCRIRKRISHTPGVVILELGAIQLGNEAPVSLGIHIVDNRAGRRGGGAGAGCPSDRLAVGVAHVGLHGDVALVRYGDEVGAQEDTGNLGVPQALLTIGGLNESRVSVLFYQLSVGSVAGVDNFLDQVFGQLLVEGNVVGHNHLEREVRLQADINGLGVVVPVALGAGGIVARHIDGAAHVVDASGVLSEGGVFLDRQSNVRAGANGDDGVTWPGYSCTESIMNSQALFSCGFREL